MANTASPSGLRARLFNPAARQKLLAFASQGADKFFGEPAFEINDFIRCDENGKGLVNIYHGICGIDGLSLPEKTPAEITEAALARSCPVCVETLDLFCHFLGVAAGNLALQTFSLAITAAIPTPSG